MCFLLDSTCTRSVCIFSKQGGCGDCGPLLGFGVVASVLCDPCCCCCLLGFKLLVALGDISADVLGEVMTNPILDSDNTAVDLSDI